MAKFSVRPDNVLLLSYDEKDYISELDKIENIIYDVKRSLRWDIAAKSNIAKSLDITSTHASGCANSMRNMQNGLEEIVRYYQNTELGLIRAELIKDTFVDGVWDFVGEFGIIGNGVKLSKDFFSNITDNKMKSWMGWGKDFIDQNKDIFDFVKKVEKEPSVSWAEDLIGFRLKKPIKEDLSSLEKIVHSNLKASDKAIHGASSVLKRKYRDFTKDLTSKTGVAKRVGGAVFSLALNGIDNIEECKNGEISAERAVVETVTETVVDWAKDLAIGTAVAAGFAAAGFAAPAIVVAGATIAVTTAIDIGCQWATGKTATEWVSDKIIDGVGQHCKKVKREVYNKWSGLKDGFKSIVNGARGLTTQDLGLVLA